MPFRKLQEKDWKRKSNCVHPEHNPPSVVKGGNERGYYEYTCPECLFPQTVIVEGGYVIKSDVSIDETTKNLKILQAAWERREEFNAKGRALQVQSETLYNESENLRKKMGIFSALCSKLRGAGDALQSKSAALFAEGNMTWSNAVMDVYGPDCAMEWRGDGCKLGSGELFTYQK